MANIEIKCNFTSVFAKYDTIEEIKSLANNICSQVKEAYEVRYKEINSGQTGVVVEVTPASHHTIDTVTKTERKVKKDRTQKAKGAESAKTDVREKASDDCDAIIDITDTKAIKKLGLTFAKYSDRCWVLRGDTKPLRKILKEQFKGVFNSHLTGGEGWVVQTARVEECAKALGLKVKL